MLLNFKEHTSPLEKWVIDVCQATTPSGTECSRDFQLKVLQGPELTEGVQSRGLGVKSQHHRDAPAESSLGTEGVGGRCLRQDRRALQDDTHREGILNQGDCQLSGAGCGQPGPFKS